MTELSPAAQAVLDAANGACSWAPDECLDYARDIAAAALRAVANQVAPEEPDYMRDAIPDAFDRQESIRAQLLAIAAELLGQGSPTL